MEQATLHPLAQTIKQAAIAKLKDPPLHTFTKAFLAGGFLALSAGLAILVTVQTAMPVVGALLFPAGFAILLVFGWELVTGNFAILPIACWQGHCQWRPLLKNWTIVFIGNMAGCIITGLLLSISLTAVDNPAVTPFVQKIVSIAEQKTAGYSANGLKGFFTACTKGILCNWLVSMGVLVTFNTVSIPGKVLLCWLPAYTFFAYSFEHIVVNAFFVPMGLMMGANMTVEDLVFFQFLPVTIGNLLGGLVLTAVPMYILTKPVATV